MKITIDNTEKLPYLEREELTATMTYEGETPSRDDVRKEIAKQRGSDEELVFVRKINTSFGKPSAEVLACVYSDKSAMENIEQKAMIERHSKEQTAGSKASSSEESEKPEGEESSDGEEKPEKEEETGGKEEGDDGSGEEEGSEDDSASEEKDSDKE